MIQYSPEMAHRNRLNLSLAARGVRVAGRCGGGGTPQHTVLEKGGRARKDEYDREAQANEGIFANQNTLVGVYASLLVQYEESWRACDAVS